MSEELTVGPVPAGGAAERARLAAKDCVHCGFCLPACPTYQLWGEEMDSPRGRIHLAAQLLDGAPLTAAAAEHFDRCLGCMACMTACPSGVQYDQIIEAAREWTEEAGTTGGPERAPAGPAGAAPGPAGRWAGRTAAERLTRAAIFALFPYPARLRLAIAPLRLAQLARADRLIARSGLAGKISPAAEQALRLAPPAVRPLRPGRLPSRIPARGQRRAVVGMLTGCVQSVFFPRVNAATARVLAAEGCDVIIPRSQGCCGALSLHSGRAAEAAGFARRTIETFEAAGVDAVIANSAGCGSAMKEYQRLLSDDPEWAQRAAALSSRVRDLAEFLHSLGPVATRHPVPVRAAYHDACHLGHAQRVTAAPRALLRGIPDLELVELREAGMCCGSAGVYNLLQPEAARALGERKADAVTASGASLLVSANPGCTLQIMAAIAARGSALRAAHTAEVLDASINGTRLG